MTTNIIKVDQVVEVPKEALAAPQFRLEIEGKNILVRVRQEKLLGVVLNPGSTAKAAAKEHKKQFGHGRGGVPMTSKQVETLAARMRQALKATGKTQAVFAQEMHLHKSFINSGLRGAIKLFTNNWVRVCKALGVEYGTSSRRALTMSVR